MKNIFISKTGLSIFFAIFSIHSFAVSPYNLSDTTRKELMTTSSERCEDVVVIKEANIVYPALLSGNEQQSIDYVEKFSAARKDYLIRTYKRSKELFPKAEAILKKHDVPKEFKVLLALESGFNADAVSRAGAVGYWQFMDEVAKEYGLKIPQRIQMEIKKRTRGRHKKTITTKITKLKGIDERKNFNKSTIAAARYLRDRSRNLDNDWLLIAASYNCGVGNVWNAMERCGKRSPTFWDIKKYLPAETRSYVMNFITLNVIFNNYEAFAKNELYFRDITCKTGTAEEMPVKDLPCCTEDNLHSEPILSVE